MPYNPGISDQSGLYIGRGIAGGLGAIGRGLGERKERLREEEEQRKQELETAKRLRQQAKLMGADELEIERAGAAELQGIVDGLTMQRAEELRQAQLAEAQAKQQQAAFSAWLQYQGHGLRRQELDATREARGLEADLARQRLDYGREQMGWEREKQAAELEFGRDRMGLERETLGLRRDQMEAELRASQQQAELERQRQVMAWMDMQHGQRVDRERLGLDRERLGLEEQRVGLDGRRVSAAEMSAFTDWQRSQAANALEQRKVGLAEQAAAREAEMAGAKLEGMQLQNRGMREFQAGASAVPGYVGVLQSPSSRMYLPEQTSTGGAPPVGHAVPGPNGTALVWDGEQWKVVAPQREAGGMNPMDFMIMDSMARQRGTTIPALMAEMQQVTGGGATSMARPGTPRPAERPAAEEEFDPAAWVRQY